MNCFCGYEFKPDELWIECPKCARSSRNGEQAIVTLKDNRIAELEELVEYWKDEYTGAKLRIKELEAEIKRLREGIKLARRIKDHGYRCERLDDLLNEGKR